MNRIYKDLLILIILITVVLFLWFSKGLIFAGGEEGIPFYDLNRTVELLKSTWWDVSGGYSNQLIINRLPYFLFLKSLTFFGIPNFSIQAIHFFIIMFFGSISMYFLVRELLKDLIESETIFKSAPLIGAIFYLLNPFSMTQVWGRGIYLQFFPFALFPFFLLMIILGLQRRNIVYGILGLLASVVFAGTFGNPSYIFSFWVIVLLYFLFHIYINRSKKNIIFLFIYISSLLIGWVLLHFWWINSFLNGSSNQFDLALNNTELNIGTLKGISKDYQLPTLLRLMHDGIFFRDHKYGVVYSSIPFILISWIIPFMAMFSLKILRTTRNFLFLAGFFLFSLFICLGSNPPGGVVFTFIFKTMPAFQALRNPFEKFGIVLTLAYTPFFAVGLIIFSQLVVRIFNNRRWFFLTQLFLLILTSGIFLWPIWTGQFAGGFKISPWIKVPHYYEQANNWLNLQQDDVRIIHFPINPGDGLRYSRWDYPYQGIEPGEFLFDRASIGKNGQTFKDYYNILLKRFDKFQPSTFGQDPDTTNSDFKSNYLFEELAKLNVRYIILHKDIDPEVGRIGSFETVEKLLSNEKNIKKSASFGLLDIYKVEYPDEIQLIFSPSIKTEYKKINQNTFLVKTMHQNSFELYFLENYDPNWEFYIDGEKIGSHYKAYSYANGWKIDKNGEISGIIKYKPQQFVDQGIFVSMIAAGGAVSLCLGYLIWKMNKFSYER